MPILPKRGTINECALELGQTDREKYLDVEGGILSGDLIVALDNEEIQGLTLEEAVEKMRGPANSTITLTVVRKGMNDPFDVKMIREVIQIKPVRYPLYL